MLPQVIPKTDLEAWLADRVKFHAVPGNREVLKTVLKTYLNGGKPVPPPGTEPAAAAPVSSWNDTLDDE